MAYLRTDSFVFNGISSSQFNLVIAWFDENPSFNTGLTCEVQKGEMNLVRHIANQYGTLYSGVLEFSFALVHIDGSDFSYEESRNINNWLRGTDTYQILHFNDESPEFINYYAICTSIEDYVYSGINGKKVTFSCNSPFGFKHKIKTKKSVADVEIFKMLNSSDDGIYYPKIYIETDSSYTNKVIIENMTDNKSFTIDFNNIKSNDNKKVVTVDGQYTQVTDGTSILPVYKLGWGTDYTSEITDLITGGTKYINYIYWFRLLQGINNIKITGTCTVTFTCEFPRKVGVL